MQFLLWGAPIQMRFFLESLKNTARERLMKAREANFQYRCKTNSWMRHRPSLQLSRDSSPDPRGNASLSLADTEYKDTRQTQSSN